MHYTIPQLQALDRLHPTQRKLLLVPSVNFGRELLGALARKSGSWVGWEVATLGTIAQQLSLVELAVRRLHRGSDVAIDDLINTSFDRAVAAGEMPETLAKLAWSSGTRAAITDAVLELRMATVTGSGLLAAVDGGTSSDSRGGNTAIARSLSAILVRYERLLAERNLADTSTMFAAASDAFDAQAPFVLDHSLLVATPGWTVRGSQRRLLGQMVQHGLKVLKPLSISHLAPPDGLIESLAPEVESGGEIERASSSVSIFYAGNPADEMREVVRRSVLGGYGLDEIEVACTDRDLHGAVLEALCSHLGASMTALDGFPVEATRIGRAVGHWFGWIESGYTADHIRRALESGDWVSRSAETGASTADIVSELRRLRVGWGLEATVRAVARVRKSLSGELITRHADESDADFRLRHERRAASLAALLELLEFLIEQAPHAPAVHGKTDAQISVSTLAARTEAVLHLIEPHGPAEHATLQRIIERLQQIASVSRANVSIVNALATLRQELSDLRAWTSSSNTSRPRRATGGHIHLTNIESAGATSRPLLFLVGLDADRTAGPVLQSPLLPEWLRGRLNDRGAGLATIEQRRRERAWQLAIAIGGSQAAVTLSYATQGGADGKESGPSPALLHAAREVFGTPSLNYDELPDKLGEPASAVPTSADAALDTRDAILAHMQHGALLLDATRTAREIFPGLDRGLQAAAERDATEAGHYHGIVPAAGELDPRRTQKPVSPSQLEMLAACSMRWFYSVALNARLPEEPEFDAMQWLNVLDRGTALHLVYERVIRAGLHETENSEERRAEVSLIVQAVAAETALRIPVSSQVVRDREVAALERDAQLFANSEHDAFKREPWTTLELELPFGAERTATFPLDDNSVVHIHGRVDRVDRLADGTLRLVDYKTGRSFELDTKRGAFDGGRKLQLALYSPAVSRHFDAAVSIAEYHFPTHRGEGVVAAANQELLDAAPRIVRSMLDDVAAGRFVPTIDKSDCAYCNFAAICRTSVGSFNATSSPRADWAKANSEDSPHFVGIISRLGKAGGK